MADEHRAGTTKRTSQLHELIAVEASLVNSAKVQHADILTTFSKRADHFVGIVKDVTFYDAARQMENEHDEKAMVDTVDKRIDYALHIYSRLFDALLQKEEANQRASADMIVGDTVIAKGVPATMLLGLETRLKLWQEIIAAAPTLEPSVPWVIDPGQGKNVYRSPQDLKKKTELKVSPLVLYPATDKHPAQVKETSEQVPVANITQTTYSAKWPVARKAEVLERLDMLIVAVKKARQRANQVATSDLRIGEAMRDFLLA